MKGMTRYEDMMNQHDFYETEARLTRNPFKKMIFKYLAADWKDKAMNLNIEEALR